MIVGILITLSVFIGDVLQYIPVAALYGLFLYLGLFCLKGMQLIVFLRVVLTRRKYWGEWALLDGLPNRQVVVFTLIWLLELIVLLVLLLFSEFPLVKKAAASLPFVLLLAGLLRRFAMPRWKWIAPYLDRVQISQCACLFLSSFLHEIYKAS
ncbi:unnamed protein product [Dibothriocephalus latus]|uniref:Bicarbonate transporter-like transmembrane domain-containing protein n=1 Tax=Dibothriocephalus latus TaxID=60516 RepID=A0A3P7RD19_DIBLA|nr:unnamed protein product [Dibothriocephalus latus]